MCGRYSLSTPLDELVESFDVTEVVLDDHRPRYNVAPTDHVPVVVQSRAGRRLGALRWGLVPPWAKDPSVGNRMINARSETVASRPAFRDAFQRRRCLVPADGFFEWMSAEPGEGRGGRRRKVPFWIHRPDRAPFALAGIWERWCAPDGETLSTFTILTTDANERLRPLHDRMPVVLPPESYGLWLDRSAEADSLGLLLRPLPDDALEAWPVTSRVSTPGFEHPSCLDRVPLEEAAPLSGLGPLFPGPTP